MGLQNAMQTLVSHHSTLYTPRFTVKT